MLAAAPESRFLGRYVVHDEIASGGMATVYFGRLVGPVGFSRIVALKRLHPQFAKDADLATGLLDEARVVSRIRHPNVVQVVDVISTDGELVLVLDYVHGESLARLLRNAKKMSRPASAAVTSAIVGDVLRGLHAAHEAKSETGQSLELIHRDISPQNILVHEDGLALVTDFGIARAVGRLQITTEDQLKGKPGYMAPEQVLGETMTRRTDIFAAGIVLWEMLTGHRLFHADNNLALMRKLLDGRIDPPSRVRPGLPPAVDALVLRALARSPEARFATAKEMLEALEQVLPPAPTAAVAEWARPLAQEALAKRTEQLRHIEAERIEIPTSPAPVVVPSTHPTQPLPTTSRPETAPWTSPMTPVGSSPSFPGSFPSTNAVTQGATPANAPALLGSSDPGGPRTSPTMVVPSPDAQKSRNTLMFLVMIIVVLIGGMFIWVRADSSSQTPDATSNALPASQIAPATALPSMAAPTTAPPPVSASVVPIASPVPNTTEPSTVKAPKVTPRPTSPSPANDCNPPYYIDARGIKVFKKQCLGAR